MHENFKHTSLKMLKEYHYDLSKVYIYNIYIYVVSLSCNDILTTFIVCPTSHLLSQVTAGRLGLPATTSAAAAACGAMSTPIVLRSL